MITSYSSIQKFTQCPRSWYLGEVRNLGPVVEKRTGALGFGGRMHAALEMWLEGKVSEPVDAWHGLMGNEYARMTELGMFDTEELDQEGALGLIMLEGFQEWWETEGEGQRFELVAVEKKVSNVLRVDTPQGEEVGVNLYGKLDRLLRDRESGFLWIADWKTTKGLEESSKAGVETSPQGRIYRALLRQELPEENIAGIKYTFLRKVKRTGSAKPPFYFDYEMWLPDYNVEHHMDRVRAWAGKMVDTRNATQAGVPHTQAAPFTPGWYCNTCVFKNPCWLMQTSSMQAAEDMLADQFHEVDPLRRYKEEVEEAVTA